MNVPEKPSKRNFEVVRVQMLSDDILVIRDCPWMRMWLQHVQFDSKYANS